MAHVAAVGSYPSAAKTLPLNGPVPDPVQILCAMIADLRKPNGALNVPGLYAKVARLRGTAPLIRPYDATRLAVSLPGPSDAVEPQEPHDGRALGLSGQLQAVTDSRCAVCRLGGAGFGGIQYRQAAFGARDLQRVARGRIDFAEVPHWRRRIRKRVAPCGRDERRRRQ